MQAPRLLTLGGAQGGLHPQITWRPTRAKKLVCGELIQATLAFRGLIDGPSFAWVSFPDPEKVLQTSAWQEHRAYLADTVSKNLWNELAMIYSRLELERARLVLVEGGDPIDDEEIAGLRRVVAAIERVRAALGCGGGWEVGTE